MFVAFDTAKLRRPITLLPVPDSCHGDVGFSSNMMFSRSNNPEHVHTPSSSHNHHVHIAVGLAFGEASRFIYAYDGPRRPALQGRSIIFRRAISLQSRRLPPVQPAM